MKLIVTESDNGDSLTLPGEWSAENVDYDGEGNSVTTYEVNENDKPIMEQALEEADGVVSYRFYSDASYAAHLLRSIPSEARSEQSRINGGKGDPESHRRGGRKPRTP